LACLRVVSNEIDEFEQVIKPDTFWLPLLLALLLLLFLLLLLLLLLLDLRKAETQ